MTEKDTIAAIATPAGRGGIGIVRVSGPEALSVVAPMLRLNRPLAAGRARRAQVLDPATGQVMDEAVATYFAAPHSYTTEDVVEIACHGAPVLLAAVLAGCFAQGARLAEPGEFTQRAYLAGRLDLTEAEAVHDLVSASTLAQARTAAAQLGGSLSRAVAPGREGLLALIAELEAGIDFAEDDLDLLTASSLLTRLDHLLGIVVRLEGTYRFGRVLHTGLTLAVTGRPNAGKSSLFNRLLGENRAIVTSQPGTTRDPIAETFDLEGIPVRLVDTAGLRFVPEGSAGEPERQGVARSREIVADADVVLVIEDASQDGFEVDLLNKLPEHTDPLLQQLATEAAAPGGRPVLRVLTKVDLLDEGQRATLDRGALTTSAVTGEGLTTLRRAILDRVTGSAMQTAEGAVVTNLRQHSALRGAVDGLHAARRAAEDGLPHELLLLDLYRALESLDLLTGATERDEVLNRIFSTFCIGK